MHRMTTGENLFTLAERHHTDWLSLWSLNVNMPNSVKQAGMGAVGKNLKGANPDWNGAGDYVYYGHPYRVGKGETCDAIAERFGVNCARLMELNPQIDASMGLDAGSQICIVADWSEVVDRQGVKLCKSMAATLKSLH